MKAINKTEKQFDTIKIMRKIRDEISLEIMDMSYVEERAYINKLLAEGKNIKSSENEPGINKG